jgi:hypothetical protein
MGDGGAQTGRLDGDSAQVVGRTADGLLRWMVMPFLTESPTGKAAFGSAYLLCTQERDLDISTLDTARHDSTASDVCRDSSPRRGGTLCFASTCG